MGLDGMYRVQAAQVMKKYDMTHPGYAARCGDYIRCVKTLSLEYESRSYRSSSSGTYGDLEAKMQKRNT